MDKFNVGDVVKCVIPEYANDRFRITAKNSASYDAEVLDKEGKGIGMFIEIFPGDDPECYCEECMEKAVE